MNRCSICGLLLPFTGTIHGTYTANPECEWTATGLFFLSNNLSDWCRGHSEVVPAKTQRQQVPQVFYDAFTGEQEQRA